MSLLSYVRRILGPASFPVSQSQELPSGNGNPDMQPLPPDKLAKSPNRPSVNSSALKAWTLKL